MSWDFRKIGTRICVCYNVTNDQALTSWRSEESPSVESLSKRFNCGQNCGMCIPYFRTLLKEFQRGAWPCNSESESKNEWFGVKNG